MEAIHLHMEDTKHSSSYTIGHLTDMKIGQGDDSVGKILVGKSWGHKFNPYHSHKINKTKQEWWQTLVIPILGRWRHPWGLLVRRPSLPGKYQVPVWDLVSKNKVEVSSGMSPETDLWCDTCMHTHACTRAHEHTHKDVTLKGFWYKHWNPGHERVKRPTACISIFC